MGREITFEYFVDGKRTPFSYNSDSPIKEDYLYVCGRDDVTNFIANYIIDRWDSRIEADCEKAGETEIGEDFLCPYVIFTLAAPTTDGFKPNEPYHNGFSREAYLCFLDEIKEYYLANEKEIGRCETRINRAYVASGNAQTFAAFSEFMDGIDSLTEEKEYYESARVRHIYPPLEYFSRLTDTRESEHLYQIRISLSE